MLVNREQNFPNNQLEQIVSQQTNCNSDATKKKRAFILNTKWSLECTNQG